ncbi:MAG: Bro-N domain-containing protein [Simkaniaceae bacterium]|nr:Bro-N domain-containing protein [Candidatus Sacchlamyda saccharinae]
MKKVIEKHQPIIVFKGKQIRRTLHNSEWWFVVKDIIEALTESSNATDYIKKMKQRDPQLAEGWGQFVTPLSIETSGGLQKLNCANTEGIFRIIQSIPSPKAEPFKKWLAKVGYERVQEIEDPELATKRTRALYKAKGYPDDWIEKRMRGIAIREQLTNEWEQRGIKEQREYSILTAEISEATFGMKPSEHKQIKSLQKENLRDHMTDLELVFSMLGEVSTTEIAVQSDAQGFDENKEAAKAGGGIAGNARRELEEKTGQKVVSSSNFLNSTIAEEEDPELLPEKL